MRSASIVSEAWRNILAGTTRAAVFALVFVVTSGGLVIADTRTIVSLIQEGDQFRTAGAAVVTLTAAGAVDGAACDSLRQVEGVRSAGALRNISHGLAVRTLPSDSIPTWEITPGFTEVVTGSRLAQSGVLVSRSVADLVNASPGADLTTSRGPVTVSAVYPFPEDGRLPSLEFATLTPVPASGRFDACWAEVWPPNPVTADLLRTSIAAAPATSAPIVLGQLNSRFGESFDGPTQFEGRATRYAALTAVLAALALGFASVWLRRLEVSSARHCGVSRRAILAQMWIEASGWSGVAVLVCLPAMWLAATIDNPDHGSSLLGGQLRCLLLAAAAAGVGAVIAATMTREDHLLRYAKSR